MKHIIYVLNGPNLNLLGERQPLIYGSDTLGEIEGRCIETGEKLGLEVHFFQSNAEHELVDLIQEARRTAAGIVINAAAYSHTSVAILDALNACEFPVIEVHISNVHKRESFRHFSYVSKRADGVIVGCGPQGYEFALQRLATLLDK
ncbi:MAG: type II 3-dehydroquinate dehydratase [Nitratireductor sp.]|nr:type II 3-dehydroquinate dehydratase [Nitratireductor sp.]